MPVSSLRELLAPYDEATFLRDDWTRRFVHVKGASARFSGLMGWGELNHILSQHELDEPRLRIVKEGRPVGEPPYLLYGTLGGMPQLRVPRLDMEALAAHLRDGATLVLDRVDALHDPIGALMRGLEKVFGCDVRTNLYAGWRTTEGFDLHWDDHDVIILQAQGRKHWRVYAPTRRYPLRNDIEPATDRPETPLWEGYLEAGDLIYIPRGFWHVAVPLDEPTLHLTCGFVTRTAEDLLGWMARNFRGSEVARMDLPRLADPATRRAHLVRLKREFETLWSDDLLDDYFAHLDRNALRRPDASLPFAAFDNPFPGGGGMAIVEWRTARCHGFDTDADETIRIQAHGKKWEFAAAAAPILKHLMQGGRHAVPALCAAFADTVAEDQLLELLGSLLHDGLIVAVEGEVGTAGSERAEAA